jgi:hypothetical protein
MGRKQGWGRISHHAPGSKGAASTREIERKRLATKEVVRVEKRILAVFGLRCLVRVFNGGVVGVDGLRRGMMVVMNVVGSYLDEEGTVVGNL